MATRLKRTAAPFEIVPLSPAIGAEIRGLDLRDPIDGTTAEALRRAIGEHSVLLLRDQDITEEQQFAYARVFGPIAPRVRPPTEEKLKALRAGPFDPDDKMQLISDRTDEDGRNIGALGHGEMWFHTDKCYIERPYRISFLYPTELPTSGGLTRFASLYRAYERVPEDLKRRLEGRKVLQIYDYTKTGVADLSQSLDELLHYWQPVFVTNPTSGRKAVYVSRLMSIRIDGMDEAESRDVLDRLCDIIEQPDNIYEHVWRLGDIIAWDNLSTVHARTDWPEGEHRTMRRCLTQGEPLY